MLFLMVEILVLQDGVTGLASSGAQGKKAKKKKKKNKHQQQAQVTMEPDIEHGEEVMVDENNGKINLILITIPDLCDPN